MINYQENSSWPFFAMGMGPFNEPKDIPRKGLIQYFAQQFPGASNSTFCSIHFVITEYFALCTQKTITKHHLTKTL